MLLAMLAVKFRVITPLAQQLGQTSCINLLEHGPAVTCTMSSSGGFHVRQAGKTFNTAGESFKGQDSFGERFAIRRTAFINA